MTRRYGILFAAILAAAGLMALLGRAPGSGPAPPPAAPVEAAPRMALRLTLGADGIGPARARVPLGHRVDFEIINERPDPARLALSGYEERVDLELPAQGRATVTLLADRPGEGFAWLVDGVPAGRLEVAGSHLVEGHR